MNKLNLWFGIIIVIMVITLISCNDSISEITDTLTSDTINELDSNEIFTTNTNYPEVTARDHRYDEYEVYETTDKVVAIYVEALTELGGDIPQTIYVLPGSYIFKEVYCYDPIKEINDSNYQYLEIKNPGMPYVSMLYAVMYYRVPISNITE